MLHACPAVPQHMVVVVMVLVMMKTVIQMVVLW